MVRVLSLCFLAALSLAALAQPLPVEEFFKRPDYSQLKLSPDGTRVAAIVRGEKRDGLAVLSVDTKKGQPVTNFADADVLEFHWINNHRLVFSTGDAHMEWAKAEHYGWFAVNADGSHLEDVGPPLPDASKFAGYVSRARISYLGPHPDAEDDIVIEVRVPEFLVFGSVQRMEDRVSVWRWNTMTARRVEDLGGGELTGAWQWVVDRRGVLRVARTYHEGREKIWYRSDAASPWRVIEEAEEFKLKFYPLAFDFDNQTFYVAAREDADKLAIYRYDLANYRLGERLARHLDVDMDEIIFSRGQRRLLGFKYDAERAGVAWVDEHMARVQQMVNRALPNTVNELSAAEGNPSRVLVTAYSDVEPAAYYLLDAEKRTLNKFASSRPWIKTPEMSERKFVRYKARDGLEIPAYLTLPKGSPGKNLPVVVEIHGGPWTGKQTWEFDLHAQFLASRGYAVLQPDFRGTRGYGKRHFEASWRQWGLSMQDDISDGLEWLIAQGIADKNRVCLFGGSYGGYATLWGLMKTPDSYRCGVTFAALTDIASFFSFNRWDWGRAVWSEYGARKAIGDPERDAEQFKSVSPVAQAERLKAPVLLAYGGFDQRVSIKNGTALRAALDRYGKKYEWVVYPEEGHGLGDDKNRFDFYRRVEAFLKQHLPPGEPSAKR